MIDDIMKDAGDRMAKSVESLRHELSKVRTGRANTSLLDHVKVPAYGAEMPLNQVASVSVGDARTLTVQPWDKSNTSAVEKAIATSDLGLNPVTAGDVIRVPMPALTEERRKELIKIVRSEAESAKVAVRNIRRDAINDIKSLLKEKDLSEDDAHRGEEEVQKVTDKYVAEVDQVLADKEKDLMEI